MSNPLSHGPAHSQSGGEHTTGASGPMHGPLADAETLDARSGNGATAPERISASHAHHDLPRDSFPGYQIISRVGEGGFGVVYLAEQTEPIRRRVALKVLKAGMDCRQILHRFEAERQALAFLDHPAIAKIYDAGTSREGLPFFAMEYIPGVPITVHCDRERMGIRERLELFARVCDAIAHAHTKGIIHRDLKPGNILVTVQNESTPLPKIIDFGVAKMLQPLPGVNPAFTELGVWIGTLEYMSPEQTDPGMQNIDIRSDVYSLGIILYQLLTGALPFDSDSLRAGTAPDIRKIIRESEPPRPSAVLSVRPDSAQASADQRKTRPADLMRTLRDELEWIPLKAIRKDRTERYQSAAQLAEDIRNYLAGLPLRAGPLTLSYRTRKLVRRHRAAFATTALVLLALAVSTGIAVRSVMLRASDYERSRGLVRLTNQILERTMSREATNVVGLSDLLDKTADELRSQRMNDTEFCAYIASWCFSGYRSIERYEEALEMAQLALAWREEALGPHHPDSIAARGWIGIAMHLVGRSSEALGLLERAVREHEQAFGPLDDRTLEVRANLAAALVQQNRTVEARPILIDVIARASNPKAEIDRAPLAEQSLAALELQEKNPEAARRLACHAANALEDRLGAAHPYTLRARGVEGAIAFRARDLKACEEILRSALPFMKAVLGDDAPTTKACVVNLGVVLIESGRGDEAIALVQPVLERCLAHPGKPTRSTEMLGHTLKQALGDREPSPAQRDLLDRAGVE